MKPEKVKRSIERFRDYSSDLLCSDNATFNDRLRMLVNFLENDEVLSRIDKQLAGYKADEFYVWYSGRKETFTGMAGSGDLEFPTNINDRIAFMYQIIKKVNSEELSLINFVRCFFATGPQYNSMISTFNDAVSMPLFREINYKLEEIVDELPTDDKQDVNPSVIQIIGQAHTVVQQSVVGDNNKLVASIANSQLDDEFDSLRAEMKKYLSGSDLNDSLEAVDSAQQLIKSDPPKRNPAKILLNTLPHIGNIGTIVASILTIISNIPS
ncbi:hypothetical protein [Vreelandella venusta]|uniref:hypothetical protein n=1 Tax=Vreelandella venusta TaxID=44935 RepID=UPI0018DA6C35|nr:hypothetical protein [Halomonas venusta]QPI65903.1 hypothetical protein IR195_09495 [Halomonas venusta]